jgi:hypothetical protein
MNTDEKIIAKADVRFEKTHATKITSGIIVFILLAAIFLGFVFKSHITRCGPYTNEDDEVICSEYTYVDLDWYLLDVFHFGKDPVYGYEKYYDRYDYEYDYRKVTTGYENDIEINYVGVLILALLCVISLLLPTVGGALLLKHESKITAFTISDSAVYGSYNRFLTKKNLNMPIDKIDNLTVMTGVFDKIRSGATVGVCSASGIIKIHFVQNAEEVVSAALARIEELRAETKKEQPVVQPVAPAQTTAADKLKELSVMKEQGFITDEEFNNKREEILKNM